MHLTNKLGYYCYSYSTGEQNRHDFNNQQTKETPLTLTFSKTTCEQTVRVQFFVTSFNKFGVRQR